MKIAVIIIVSVLGFTSTSFTPVTVPWSQYDHRTNTQQLRQGNMPAVEFKNQKYCRVELPDFEFDIKFKVVSATVYFSGANFKEIKVGRINSNDLSSISEYMKQCTAGTNVTFDKVKVTGPDNEIREIAGVSYLLY